MIYVLSYCDYDTYVPVILEGPEVADWNSHCNDLLKDVISRLVQEQQDKYNSNPHSIEWLGWNDIKDEMVMLLCENGYRLVNPPEKTFNGPGIIRSELDLSDNIPRNLDLTDIYAHNMLVEKQLYDSRTKNNNMD